MTNPEYDNNQHVPYVQGPESHVVGPPMPPEPQAPKKSNKTRNVVLAVIFAITAFCLLGTVIIALASNAGKQGIEDGKNAGSAPLAAPTTKSYPTVGIPTTLPPVKPTKAAPKPPPTIEEGTWTVGVDVPAGTYRVQERITSGDCYWSITKTGSNGDDIISNDIVSGGRPQVTLKKGQDFESNRCGTWVKIK